MNRICGARPRCQPSTTVVQELQTTRPNRSSRNCAAANHRYSKARRRPTGETDRDGREDDVDRKTKIPVVELPTRSGAQRVEGEVSYVIPEILTTAANAASCMAAENTEPGSCHPSKAGGTGICAVEDIGNGPVMPCTTSSAATVA